MFISRNQLLILVGGWTGKRVFSGPLEDQIQIKVTAGKHQHLQCSCPTGCARAGAGWSTVHRLIVCLELERTPRDHSVPVILLWPETPCLCTSASTFPDNKLQSNSVSFLQKIVNFSVVGASLCTRTVCCCTAYLHSGVTSVSYFEDKKGEKIFQKLCTCSNRADYCNGNDKGRQS